MDAINAEKADAITGRIVEALHLQHYELVSLFDLSDSMEGANGREYREGEAL